MPRRRLKGRGERLVGDRPRHFGRDRTVYNPWHYMPVMLRVPGALRISAPFKVWVLPRVFEEMRRKLPGSSDGDRQMVKVLTEGQPAVKKACAEVLSQGAHSADPQPADPNRWRRVVSILNILSRRHDPEPPPFLLTSGALRLTHEAVAGYARYDPARGGPDDGSG